MDQLNNGQEQIIVADPLLEQLIRDKDEKNFFALPHVAVSSKLYWDQVPQYLGDEMDAWLAEIAQKAKQLKG